MSARVVDSPAPARGKITPARVGVVATCLARLAIKARPGLCPVGLINVAAGAGMVLLCLARFVRGKHDRYTVRLSYTWQ